MQHSLALQRTVVRGWASKLGDRLAFAVVQQMILVARELEKQRAGPPCSGKRRPWG